MLRFIVQRLIGMIPVVLLVTGLVFSLILLIPGDPAIVLMGEEAFRDPDTYQRLIREMGLDRPIPVQYVDWLGRAVRGDLGRSVRDNQPVLENLLGHLPVTLELSFLAMLFSAALALPVGIVSASKPNSKTDVIGTFFAIWAVGIPHFWLGLLLILVFSLYLGWLPASGYVSPLDNLGENLLRMILPAFTLGTGLAAVVMRQVRSAMLEVLQQDYVLTARAKGLRERAVILRHALKNALIPVTTILGLQFGQLFGGAVVTETIFAIPGVGRMLVDALFTRDFPMVQGVMVLLAIAVLICNLATDIMYVYIDPRIRY